LVEDYESNKNSVKFQILALLFEACGAKHEIYPDYLRESDVDDIVLSLVDLARKVSFFDLFRRVNRESSSV